MPILCGYVRPALVVTGRRVVQPFHPRSFVRGSLPRRTEPIPHDPRADVPSSSTTHDAPRHSRHASPRYPVRGPTKKRNKLPPPHQLRAKKQTLMTRESTKKVKRPKTVRGTVTATLTRTQKPRQEPVVEHAGFTPHHWAAGWGKDELAPPHSSTNHRSPKLRPRKEIVPAVSDPSPSTRPLPPHRIPYLRRAEGYISVETEQSNSVLRDVESPSAHKPIAQLAHGLDRVLFNPGVYWLKDPRSRIYNFTPWLESIPAVTDFAFERVTGFVKSSMDDDLWKIAKQHKRPFAGSTSSLTGLLSHCYFLVSGDKEVDTTSLSRAFLHEPTNFTPGQRMPTSVQLNYKEGVWLIDSDKADELAEKNVLTWMGTMLEKFLTVPMEEFKKLSRSAPAIEDADTRREAYRYVMSDRFIMRSQLDCVDPRLPGTGVFDIKTRAAVPIRLDILNYEENSGYLIKTLTGPLESFEKEYYDLIRSGFLKYSFQARIGNMDGVLVAYHNTARIFGFQYVSLEEMEGTLYGSGNGARVFNMCLSLLEKVLSDIVSIYGERSVKCTFETRELSQELNVFIQPVEWDEEVEGKPCPITELDVRGVSYLDGEEAKGARAVADHREWMVHWTLTESALDDDTIRRRLTAAHERQFRALSFPAGISTLEEMEKAWAKINFSGKQSVQEMVAVIKELESRPTTLSELEVSQETNLRESVPPDSPSPLSAFPSPLLTFREPAEHIQQLRQLALQGREETLKEEAECREKVVWGFVDGWSDGRVREEDPALGCGTLPGADESVEAVKVGGVVVSAPSDGGGGDGELEVSESDGRAQMHE